VILQALSATALLFIVASGLAVVLGLMNVINMAHPGLMAVAAYVTVWTVDRDVPLLLGMLAGIAFASLCGLLLEPVVRRLYTRPLDTILATWGISLVITQLLALMFGRAPRNLPPPVRGVTDLGPVAFSTYRLLLVGVAVAIALALHLVLTRTNAGLAAKTAMSNPELAQAVGVDVRRVQRATFVLGCALAGAAGVLIAPLATIDPYMGVNYLIPAFLAVLLAGRSIGGLAFACAVLATVQTVVSFKIDAVLGSIMLVCVAVALLRYLPDGFNLRAVRRPSSRSAA
jgi:branched-chain amino acid transport system permease protein